tara:strand:- start:339 stop:530 length:192 start_codon:yes stop_codon:yes gene_type:complete
MRDRMMRSTQKIGEEIAGLIRTQEEAENRVKELFKPRIAAAKTLCERLALENEMNQTLNDIKG